HTGTRPSGPTATATTPTRRKRNPKPTRHCNRDAPTAVPAAACWLHAGADGGGGAFGFGLKAIAKNLYKHGLIETSWDDGPVDGLGAMVGAWYCNRQVAGTGQSMRDMDYMQEIEAYNEVDCKVMWELVNYLRENHI
ncbi:MAG: hypothetical protein QF372_05285, partial [Candidatus Poseidoniia archaeon]|nr:hypothetical protein [Candidatus Poseidoniia archaeon]